MNLHFSFMNPDPGTNGMGRKLWTIWEAMVRGIYPQWEVRVQTVNVNLFCLPLHIDIDGRVGNNCQSATSNR